MTSMHVVVDLEDQYHFLPCLAHTDLQPAFIIYSKSMELTVCFETNFEEAKRERR